MLHLKSQVIFAVETPSTISIINYARYLFGYMLIKAVSVIFKKIVSIFSIHGYKLQWKLLSGVGFLLLVRSAWIAFYTYHHFFRPVAKFHIPSDQIITTLVCSCSISVLWPPLTRIAKSDSFAIVWPGGDEGIC